MKLAIGADHAGFKLKSELINWLRTAAGGKHQILDVGTASEESCDYPDFARGVASAVAAKRAAKGILVCGTGVGMAIAANKTHGIRAGVAWTPEIAELAAEHNDLNVLCIPGRFANLRQARQIIQTFLKTPFGGGRHLRRIKKIQALDRCV